MSEVDRRTAMTPAPSKTCTGTATVDHTFAEAVLIAGLIGQHLHPSWEPLTTAVIAFEDWVVPRRTFPAAF